MRKPRINRFRLLVSVGMLVAIGAIVLGVYQFRWIRDSNQSRIEQERRSMLFALENAMEEVGSELWALLSFAIVPADPESGEVDISSIVESVDLWKGQSRIPDLLNTVLFVSGLGTTFELVDGAAIEISTPDRLQHLADSGKNFGWGPPNSSFYSDGTIILPYARVGDKGDVDQPGALPNITGHLVVEVDLFVMFHDLLRSAMETYLPGYEYRIVRDGRVVYARDGDGVNDREPDVARALLSPLLSRVVRWNATPSGGTESIVLDGTIPQGVVEDLVADSLPRDPVSRYWSLRIADRARSDLLVDRSDASILEVFSPDTSLATTLRRRLIADLSLSYGVLALFIGVLFLMYRFSKRSEEFRLREHEFVSAMSHELRTPVSVIKSISENLADGVSLEKSRLNEYGALIREQSERLGRMVESILMTSGLDQSRHARIEWTSTNIAGLIEDVRYVLGPTAEHAGISIEVSEKLDRDFLTDPIALRLILENLINNAMRHGVDSTVESSTIFVAARYVSDLDEPGRWLESRRLRISVSDGGRGIPKREQRKIFDAFYRGQRSRENQIQGSGLGLHLVRRVVTLLGGSVTVSSPYKRSGNMVNGTEFTVDLPEGKEKLHG